jgi:protein-L-isoaspartate(D-aspartate) O-methyltransferase
MTVDFQELRVKMVDGQVRTTDVTDAAILTAMLSIPRELFVAEARRPLAYIDEDIEIAPAVDGRSARYLMEPSPLARLLQLAGIRSTDRVLDVGAGTGYASAVLSNIASAVVGLESDASLAAAARSTLADLGVANVTIVEGPLEAGHAASAPYDVRSACRWRASGRGGWRGNACPGNVLRQGEGRCIGTFCVQCRGEAA